MKKRLFITIIISLICAGIMTGCGKSSDSGPKDKPENIEDSAEAEDETGEDKSGSKQKKKREDNKDVTVDLISGKEILACISGDWTLFDRETGEDHGTLSIGADGSFTFTRLSDNATGSGTLSF
ncbi:MAG: hypothetical protein K6F34_11575, partial [Lachnospiraceae bacterium]|nr:hypothetical protein [Lachnospiraceae bacterium]